MSDAPFSKTTLRWIIGIGVASFVGAVLLAVFGPDMEQVTSFEADAYSTSAIGHLGFAELLGELDIPVITSRHASAYRASQAGVLVIAEPIDCAPGSPRAAALTSMVAEASTVLLVLPKWNARGSGRRKGWIERMWLRESEDAANPLHALDLDGTVVRAAVPVDRPLPRTTSWSDQIPSFPLPTAQFLRHSQLEPLVAGPDGILLGETTYEDTRILVLSDPDVLSNAGLGHGANASLVIAAIERLRTSSAGGVVIDETIHGHERTPSIWRELFSFPLLPIVIQAALTLLVLLWAGMSRFGAPQRSAPPREPGRRSLIANTAELLRYRGQVGSVLTKYLGRAVIDVRRELRTPTDLQGTHLDAWLDRIGERRETHDTLTDLRAHVGGPGNARAGTSQAQLLHTAGRIHRWRTEILHGPTDHPRPA